MRLTEYLRSRADLVLIAAVVLAVGALVADRAAASLDGGQIASMYSAPLAKTSDHEVKFGDSSVSAAAWEEFPATDVPALYRSEDHVLLVTITNDHATAKICIAYIDRTAGTTDCSTLVGSVAETGRSSSWSTCGANHGLAA